MNGRHRTRYLYFAGAQEIPVMCREDQAKALLHYCGAEPAKGNEIVTNA